MLLLFPQEGLPEEESIKYSGDFQVNLLPILTGQIQATAVIGQWKGVGWRKGERRRQMRRQEDGGRGGGGKMDSKHVTWKSHKKQGVS